MLKNNFLEMLVNISKEQRLKDAQDEAERQERINQIDKQPVTIKEIIDDELQEQPLEQRGVSRNEVRGKEPSPIKNIVNTFQEGSMSSPPVVVRKEGGTFSIEREYSPKLAPADSIAKKAEATIKMLRERSNHPTIESYEAYTDPDDPSQSKKLKSTALPGSTIGSKLVKPVILPVSTVGGIASHNDTARGVQNKLTAFFPPTNRGQVSQEAGVGMHRRVTTVGGGAIRMKRGLPNALASPEAFVKSQTGQPTDQVSSAIISNKGGAIQGTGPSSTQENSAGGITLSKRFEKGADDKTIDSTLPSGKGKNLLNTMTNFAPLSRVSQNFTGGIAGSLQLSNRLDQQHPLSERGKATIYSSQFGGPPSKKVDVGLLGLQAQYTRRGQAKIGRITQTNFNNRSVAPIEKTTAADPSTSLNSRRPHFAHQDVNRTKLINASQTLPSDSTKDGRSAFSSREQTVKNILSPRNRHLLSILKSQDHLNKVEESSLEQPDVVQSSLISGFSGGGRSMPPKQLVDIPLDRTILYDCHKMYRGSQDQAVKKILRFGNLHIHNIKTQKIASDLPMDQQVLLFKDNFSPFYKDPKIKTVTEDQVRAGIEQFNSLLNPKQLEEMELARKYGAEKIKQGKEKEKEPKEPAAEEEKTAGEEEVKETFDEDKQEIPPLVLASIIKGNEEVAQMSNLTHQEQLEVQQKLDDLEMKEINIIAKLYADHFTLGKETDSSAAGEEAQNLPQITTPIQVDPMSRNRSIMKSHSRDRLSAKGEQILKNYIAQNKSEGEVAPSYLQESTTDEVLRGSIAVPGTLGTNLISTIRTSAGIPDQSLLQMPEGVMHHSQDVDRDNHLKYVQFVPENIESDKINIDTAIQSLYQREGPNLSPGDQKKIFASTITDGTGSTGSPPHLSLISQSLQQGADEPTLAPSLISKFTQQKICSKSKDVDMATLQSKAFKYIMIQKPDYDVAPNPMRQKKMTASFFPNCILSEELQKAFDSNQQFRRLMRVPDLAVDKIFSKIPRKRSKIAGESTLIHSQNFDLTKKKSLKLQKQLSTTYDSGTVDSRYEKKGACKKVVRLRSIFQSIQRKENQDLAHLRQSLPTDTRKSHTKISAMSSSQNSMKDLQISTYLAKKQVQEKPMSPTQRKIIELQKLDDEDDARFQESTEKPIRTMEPMTTQEGVTSRVQNSSKITTQRLGTGHSHEAEDDLKNIIVLESGTAGTLGLSKLQDQTNSSVDNQNPQPGAVAPFALTTFPTARQTSESGGQSSPLSNASIREHTQGILHFLQQKYKNRLDVANYKLQLEKQRLLEEELKVKEKIKTEFEASKVHFINKKIWHSPFEHRKTMNSCRNNILKTRRDNFQNPKSFEKRQQTISPDGQQTLPSPRKSQGFQQWTLTDLFKKEQEIHKMMKVAEKREDQIRHAQVLLWQANSQQASNMDSTKLIQNLDEAMPPVNPTHQGRPSMQPNYPQNPETSTGQADDITSGQSPHMLKQALSGGTENEHFETMQQPVTQIHIRSPLGKGKASHSVAVRKKLQARQRKEFLNRVQTVEGGSRNTKKMGKKNTTLYGDLGRDENPNEILPYQQINFDNFTRKKSTLRLKRD